MFTVDSMNVIDATHQGNKARFINHHCQVRKRKHRTNYWRFSVFVLAKLFC